MGWYNKVDYYYEQMEQAQNGEEEEEEQELEAGEWCQDLVGDDSAVDLYDCDYEAEEEEEDQDQQQDQQNDNGYYSSDYYTYELTEEQMDDISSVCAVYTGMIAAANAEVSANDGSYQSYTPHTTFNPEHETLFDYSAGKSSQSSGGKVFLWILLVAAVGAGAAAFFMQKNGASDKKKPLISENEGTMA